MAGQFTAFDHVHFLVSNAKTSATHFAARFGFTPIAYRSLETGSKDLCSYVLRQGEITLVFTSKLGPRDAFLFGDEIGRHIDLHGDGVKDVAFTVDDARALYDAAVARGGKSVLAPTEYTDDNGTVVVATVQTYGDTVHSFVERKNYTGVFMPGYRTITTVDPLVNVTEPLGLQFIDHIVGNMPDAGMEPAVQWYENVLKFHRFWSVDDSQIHTEYSSLRSVVVASDNEKVKMPINEPANGKRKSQIQEYVEYYGGAGVQHIALHTEDILSTISNMRKRGVEFITVPPAYYDNLKARLERANVKVAEDLDRIKELNILVDFDDNGYLLQIFTTSNAVGIRPTVFYEIISRRGAEGFGAGNFLELFRAIEVLQFEREAGVAAAEAAEKA